MKMEDRKKNLDMNAGSLDLSKKTEDMRLTLRKKKVNEKLILLMEKKYDQVKISDQLATKIKELNLPEEIKMKIFTDDSDFLAFLNFLFDNPAIDYKKFALNILKVNLNSKFYDPNVMKIDAALIVKVIENLKIHSDDLNFVFESLSLLTIFCNVIEKIPLLEPIFLDENNLNILYDIYNNKELMKIPDLLNLFVLLTLSLIQKKNLNRIAKAFKNIGIIDSLINILEERKIHVQIVSNILDLISTILQNKFDVLDNQQLLNIAKTCLMFAKTNEDQVRFSCFWITSYLSQLESKEIIDEIIKSDLLNHICAEYVIESETIIPSIRIIGNLSGNEDFYVDYLLRIGVVNFVKKILPIENNSVTKELYWACSNLTATSRNAVMKFLEDDLIIPLTKKLLFCNVFFVKEEVLFFLGNIVANADYLIAKKIMDWKLDEDMILVLKENKNPDLLSLVFRVIEELIDVNVFRKKEANDENMKERSLDNADLSNYSKVKSPFKDSFLQKGILEILDKLASHVNEDIAAQTDIIIHKLKDDI